MVSAAGTGVLFKANDRTRIVSMLPEAFVLKIPETLPYGGSFQGPDEFDRFFQRIYDDHDYWSWFRTELALGHVLDVGTHLVAPIRVTARQVVGGDHKRREPLAIRNSRRQLCPGPALRRHRRRP
jgi:hypothetical protein